MALLIASATPRVVGVIAPFANMMVHRMRNGTGWMDVSDDMACFYPSMPAEPCSYSIVT